MFGTPPRTNLTTVSVFLKNQAIFKRPFCFSRKEKKVRNSWEILSIFTVRMLKDHATKTLPIKAIFENYEIFSQKHQRNFAVSPKIQAFWEFLSNNISWDTFYKIFADKKFLEICWNFSQTIPAVLPKTNFLDVSIIIKQ